MMATAGDGATSARAPARPPSERRRRRPALRRRAPPASGSWPTTTSRRSPTPRPCRALTIAGSPSPRPASSQASASRRSESTLFATTMTWPPWRRTSCATAASSPVTPVVASSTNSTRSADFKRPDRLLGHLGVEGVAAARRARRCRRGGRSARSTRTRPRGGHGSRRVALDDGDLAADDPVHERRLADVRPADDGDDGQLARRGGFIGCLQGPAQRRPSVGTTSTRSRQVARATTPSRNGPSTGTRPAAGSGRPAARPASTRRCRPRS